MLKIVQTINALTGEEEEYSVHWRMVRKIEYFLNLAHKPMTLNAIANAIIEEDSKEKSTIDKRGTIMNISATLSTYCKKKLLFVKLKKRDGSLRYGIRDWYEESDIVKYEEVGDEE